jgi:hypothetical protein
MASLKNRRATTVAALGIDMEIMSSRLRRLSVAGQASLSKSNF